MIHDQIQTLLTEHEVAGPFVYDAWPDQGSFRTMVRVQGRGGDKQRQWDLVGVTVFTRHPERRTAEDQGGKAWRALNMREAFMAGDLFVPWSQCSGWPRPVGRDGEGHWVYRLEAELHLASS